MLTTRLLLPAALVLATTLSACAPGAPTAAATTTAPDAAAVNAAMRTVADRRAEVETAIVEVMRTVGRLPAVAQGLRSPGTVDEMLDEVPGLAAGFHARSPADLTASVDGLDAAIVAAVTAIDTTAAGLDPVSWEARYLAAQRDVLAAMGAWSGASRALVEALDASWPTFERVVDAAAVLDENRWRYRSREEAAGTWEVEQGDQLGGLTTATTTLEGLVATRDAAAEGVTAADVAADVVFEDRPASP